MNRLRLKSFSTYGFKSFADKTELTFDKGITAVVGPNGSGKSNISDAIRWVLGEQSAKYLRGSKMEDVIFNGSARRKALGMAEVNVIFDNSDHQLPLDFEEVSLTRRIYRSGDSDYQINKKNCRLKDVVDLMADTGLGKGSMAIIGQNKIDEILNSRPEERRAIFEEAAGIAKFRLRKKEAVRKLDDTASNLTRINDIKVEVESQIEPLSKEAEKTKRFNELDKELKLIHLKVLLEKLSGMEAQVLKLNEKKVEIQNSYWAKTTELGQKDVRLSELQLALDKLSEDFNRLQEEIKNKETALEKLRGEKAVLEERAKNSKAQGERLAGRNEKLEQQSQELEAKLNDLASEFDILDAARNNAQLQVTALADKKQEQETARDQINEQKNTMTSGIFAAVAELARQRNELRALEAEQERRARRRASLKEEIDAKEQQVEVMSSGYRQLLKQESQTKQELDVTLAQQNKLAVQANDVNRQVNELSKTRQEAYQRLTAAQTRHDTLQRLQSSYEGFGYGIKAALNADQPWRRGIIGPVAELIKVPDALVTAVEIALGEGAQNLITTDSRTAKQAIEYLRNNRLGRATFLPLDIIQRRNPTYEEEQLTAMAGIKGFAYDLISFPEQVKNAVSNLLGRVLIAENMDAALAAAKACRYRLRVVTVAGEVVNAGGSMTGGSKKQREGYLSRGKEIAEAESVVKQLHQEVLALQEQLEIKQEELSGVVKEQNILRGRAAQAQLRKQELSLKLEQAKKEEAREREALSYLEEERNQVTNEYMANRAAVSELRARVVALENSDSEAKAKLIELERQLTRINSELTALINRLQDANVELETSKAKSDFASENMNRLDQEILAVREEINSNIKEIGQLEQIVKDCQAESLKLDEQNSVLLGQLNDIVGGKERYNRERIQIITEQQEVENASRGLRREADSLEQKLRSVELDLTRQQSDYDHAKEQLAEDYHLDEEEAKLQNFAELEGLSPLALARRENKLTLAISDLGPINPGAVAQYEAVKERADFLKKQYDDLTSAKDALEAVIGEINSGMAKRFKEAFAKINEYFAKTYVKLFGGGTAVLVLNDPANILDSGIDIQVQPPGKKLQSLYLMSGGERALTVIALLFALLTYQPAPFCILDEIDAPLDDANIIRFANFLREYATNTQFIMITHRKGTMESADIMYGVTMEESGVSKLLSVSINKE